MRAFPRILLITVFLAGAMWAQTTDQTTAPGTPPSNSRMGRMHNGQRGFDRMAQQLNLTDQQKTQMQGIFQTERQQAQSIRQDTSLTPEQRQQKMQELRKSTHQQMMGILTPDQQKQFQQMHSQHEGMAAGKGHGMGAGGGMGHGGAMTALNLTEQQKTQMQSIMQKQQQQMQSIRQDTSLTPEQRHQKMQELRQSTHQQMMGILTPEQQQQMQQMRQQHHGEPGQTAPPPAAPPSL